jgi:cell fate (sporulation/competence/biofilm development) regulator YlbF (YheA/YmcA/DUF963 family)
MVDRNKIWEYANELGQLLAESPEVEQYKQAELAMNQHPQAQSLIRQFRELQEELTALEERGTEPKYTKPLRDRIRELVDQMDQIPEVQQFKEAQSKVNDLLGSVSQLLADSILKSMQPSSSADCGG